MSPMDCKTQTFVVQSSIANPFAELHRATLCNPDVHREAPFAKEHPKAYPCALCQWQITNGKQFWQASGRFACCSMSSKTSCIEFSTLPEESGVEERQPQCGQGGRRARHLQEDACHPDRQ